MGVVSVVVGDGLNNTNVAAATAEVTEASEILVEPVETETWPKWRRPLREGSDGM